MFSIFEYADGVFQLNVWGVVLVLMFIAAVGSRGSIKMK